MKILISKRGFLGLVLIGATMQSVVRGLYSNVLGLEGYIAKVRSTWVDPAVDTPILLIGGILAGVGMAVIFFFGAKDADALYRAAGRRNED